MYSLTHSFRGRKHVATIRSATTWVSFEVTPDVIALFKNTIEGKCDGAVVSKNVHIYPVDGAIIFETELNVTCNMQFKLSGKELIDIAAQVIFTDSHINSFVETAPAGLDDKSLTEYIKSHVCKSVAADWEN